MQWNEKSSVFSCKDSAYFSKMDILKMSKSENFSDFLTRKVKRPILKTCQKLPFFEKSSTEFAIFREVGFLNPGIFREILCSVETPGVFYAKRDYAAAVIHIYLVFLLGLFVKIRIQNWDSWFL